MKGGNMGTLVIMVLAFAGYIVMYQLYGKYIGRKIFALSSAARTPSVELEDGIDYVPTKKEVIFGHHFTSIASLAGLILVQALIRIVTRMVIQTVILIWMEIVIPIQMEIRTQM